MIRSMRRMTRLPLVTRTLLLVPLLAVSVDQARATLACGTRAESCLEAAGQGWLGVAGPVLLVLYSLALAAGVGCLVRGGSARAGNEPGFAALWLLGAGGVAAVCGGQALLASALGGAALGGGWPVLLVLCAVAGGLLALALRAAPAAEELVSSLRPPAPRAALPGALARRLEIVQPRRPAVRFALVERERGPPCPLD
jgi:hypothetical protein